MASSPGRNKNKFLWCHWGALLLQNRDDFRLNWLTGDFDVFVRNVNVDFRAHAKFSFEIDPRLDGKTNSGNNAARIARFEVVDVDAITVGFLANRMASPMCKLFAKTRSCNYATRHIVDLGAANRFASANILAHEIDRRIPGFPYNIKMRVYSSGTDSPT